VRLTRNLVLHIDKLGMMFDHLLKRLYFLSWSWIRCFWVSPQVAFTFNSDVIMVLIVWDRPRNYFRNVYSNK